MGHNTSHYLTVATIIENDITNDTTKDITNDTTNASTCEVKATFFGLEALRGNRPWGKCNFP
jgi:hypothetical protein